jgi:Spy/CpxP family protein refolding chaperone
MTAPSSPNKLTTGLLLAALVIVLAAVSGGLAGVAVDRLVLLPHMFRGPGHPRDGHGPPRDHDFREKFAREIGLTAEQQVRVDSIMDREIKGIRAVRSEVQPRLDSIIARTRRELDSVLTPDQRKKAEEMRKRHPPPPRFEGGPPPDGGPPPGEPPPDHDGPPPR